MNQKHTKKIQEIGKRIAAVRKDKGLTQEELAIKASISYSYLTKIESNKCLISFSIETLLDIAEALDVDVKNLI